MKTYTVQFKEVGRNKRSWSTEVDSYTEDSLAKIVAKSGALMSHSIDVYLNESDINAGTIVVGGFREVGSLVITKNQLTL